ncbi:MAG TPA: type 2 lanthipeptide synthetase LanM [Solirubrobacteraceae bacterium]|nr:type 2 lanthipeptide synthetase LanM [Solirubrobacteraceae bacterium]
MSEPAPWWRARSLAQRAAGGDGVGDGVGVGDALAGWRADFPDDEVLAERLRVAGGAPAELPALLAAARRGPSPGASPPAWWRSIEDAFMRGGSARASEPGGGLLDGCLALVQPLRECAERELERTAGSAAARIFSRWIALELAELSAPAVALELRASALAGDLHGDTAEARAAAFMAGLGRPQRALELLADSAALARLLHDRLRLGVDAARELLGRLDADRPKLVAQLLGGRDPGPLVAARPLGDPHDGGRRVWELEFASGARIVHKPRSLAADAAYGGLLAFLARAGLEPPPRAPATLVAGPGHGWQERVEPSACQSRGEVGRYFARLGAQLAVLHALRGIDFHHENVLAAGEHPVIVDLEGLFHPRLGGARAREVDPLVAETGMDCVLRVGLLPRADVAFGIDISGLGRDPRAEVVVEEEAWRGSGTDDVRLERRRLAIRPGANVPRLGDEPVRPADWVDELAQGFAAVHRLLRRHRDELLAPAGAVAAFAGAQTRVVLRPTRAYVQLLRGQLTDPAALADGLVRERALNALWRGARRRPDLRAAAAAEHHDLWHGDIPKLTSAPGSADLRHHALGTIAGALAPWTSEALDCLRRLDERDEERQLAFLRAAVLAAAPRCAVRRAQDVAVHRGEPLARAREVARRLAVLALRDEDGVGWLSAQPAAGHAGRVLRAAGPGLAEGDTGIALFLARLAAETGDSAARACAAAAARRVAAADVEPTGLWDGVEGVEAALALLERLLAGEPDPAAAADVAALVGRLRRDPRAAAARAATAVEQPGLIAGLAGAGLAWLGRASAAPAPASGSSPATQRLPGRV